jgi:hypothetical protein
METIVTAARAERRQPPGEPIPAAAVWASLTQAQQERVHQAVAQVCRERLREEQRDEPA